MEIKVVHYQRKKRKVENVISDPVLKEWRLLLTNYDFLYRTDGARKKECDPVIREINVLRGIIEHRHLSQPAKRRQFVCRYYNVSRAILEPPVHKRALRWLFKKLDGWANHFRKKERFSLSAYFAPTREEKLREKLEQKMYNRRRNSL